MKFSVQATRVTKSTLAREFTLSWKLICFEKLSVLFMFFSVKLLYKVCGFTSRLLAIEFTSGTISLLFVTSILNRRMIETAILNITLTPISWRNPREVKFCVNSLNRARLLVSWFSASFSSMTCCSPNSLILDSFLSPVSMMFRMGYCLHWLVNSVVAATMLVQNSAPVTIPCLLHQTWSQGQITI